LKKTFWSGPAILVTILVIWLYPKRPTEDVYYTIPAGASVLTVQNDLFKMGFESVYGVFFLRLLMTHQLKNIRAGEYLFEEGISPLDIFTKVTKGASIVHRLLIPEGLTSFQIVQLINKAPHLKGMLHDIPQEGSLFPTTLNYNKGQERTEIVGRLQKLMEQKLEELCNGFQHRHLSSPNDVLIMASIVERESRMSEERRKIAGVFLNRLEHGMRLQADPCVIYAATKGRTAGGYRLRKSDMSIDSPYNVYKYYGLPPTPICCPSEESIRAVMAPSPSDSLFFVVTGFGGHRFSKHYKEHCKNIRLWRQGCKIIPQIKSI
jgi:UPF0755 protein